MDYLPREPKPWFWAPPLSGETMGPREAIQLVEHHWRRLKAAVEVEAYRAKKG